MCIMKPRFFPQHWRIHIPDSNSTTNRCVKNQSVSFVIKLQSTILSSRKPGRRATDRLKSVNVCAQSLNSFRRRLGVSTTMIHFIGGGSPKKWVGKTLPPFYPLLPCPSLAQYSPLHFLPFPTHLFHPFPVSFPFSPLAVKQS